MTEQPILKWPNPRESTRIPSRRRNVPSQLERKPTRQQQRDRIGNKLRPVTQAIIADPTGISLRNDPAGIAPERALVFETAAPIQNFAKVANAAGLEVFAEFESEEASDVEELGFAPPTDMQALYPTLYATVPTEQAFRRLLTLWRRYQKGETPGQREGLMPWWHMFDLLIDLRVWGPEDRLPEGARNAVAERLPFDDDDEVLLELEVWPSTRDEQRTIWREQAKAAVYELGGRIVDESSIRLPDFVYDALLVGLRAGDVRAMIENPRLAGSLAGVEGIQFVLPQTIAQSAPVPPAEDDAAVPELGNFDETAPLRAVLLDGVPVANHPAINGGLVIEDVHDLERVSIVNHRRHGTAMASLILRGDLDSDGGPVHDSRILSIPVLVDHEGGATSPSNRLFLDVLHISLARCFEGEEPLAPNAFVVNLSIGIAQQRYAGRISALARLLDWWSWKYGVLFTVSAGNILDDLVIDGTTAMAFEDADPAERKTKIRSCLMDQAYSRSLLAPAEAINALTVGALSKDMSPKQNHNDTRIIRYEQNGGELPSAASALGLGPAKALKPDLLAPGGVQELRINPSGNNTQLTISDTQRTGLVVASPDAIGAGMSRCRGTSPAAALTTRSLLQAAAALTGDEGPFEGQELPRRSLALATRALAVNAASWPDDVIDFEEDAKQRLGARHSHTGVKDQIARHFGHGVLEPNRMVDCPVNGATLIGFGVIRKDQARLFRFALPPSLSGQKLPRYLRVTIAWFTPIAPSRPTYRCAALEAKCVAENGDPVERDWIVQLSGSGPDTNMIGRGSVWSRRLKPNRITTPHYSAGDYIPIRVECREFGSSGLSPDEDIEFAIAASFEVEGTVRFNVYDEIRDEIRIRAGTRT